MVNVLERCNEDFDDGEDTFMTLDEVGEVDEETNVMDKPAGEVSTGRRGIEAQGNGSDESARVGESESNSEWDANSERSLQQNVGNHSRIERQVEPDTPVGKTECLSCFPDLSFISHLVIFR